MAMVGRLLNILPGFIPIGSVQKNHELCNRPRNGLWQRKTGRFGRKMHLKQFVSTYCKTINLWVVWISIIAIIPLQNNFLIL
ncbi:hypothetical protein V1477_004596 [Vespula maculifrons]|uniref:Uncharacterized protein n=1 Tax=Vespula maculifrons TaxID=7453 RepID=A0ABD2CMD0_VESMC